MRIPFERSPLRALHSIANGIYEYELTPTEGYENSRESLFVDGPRELGLQIQDACGELEVGLAVASWGNYFPEPHARFRLRLDFPGLLPGVADEVIEAVRSHLVLAQSWSDALRHALALDWYKVIEEDVDPNDWDYTEVGRLVHDAKYKHWTRAGRSAMDDLVDRLCAVIQAHPLMREATAVTTPPSHNGETSFAIRLTGLVARQLGIGFVRVIDEEGGHAPAKERETGAVATSAYTFVCEDDCEGTIIVVDDLYRSGRSMAATAAAVSAVGADSVFGLACTKTARN